jgi:xanthine dehydrogenase YagS FAD-binding subunit
MESFRYQEADSIEAAISASAAQARGKYLAGGTTLIDLMKLDVETPHLIVDINRVPLAQVEPASDGGVRIGAMVRNSDLANHELIKQHFPVLSQALLSGASPQLRNMATTGGNLLQRTRCYYFRDLAYSACNKRSPGSGCAAMDGYNRIHAILGGSEHCVATNPSDMAVAMMALDAVVHTESAKGGRSIALPQFYRVPGDTPNIENVLEPNELITYVTLPALASGTRSHYLKLRDRASYEFALASAAVVVLLKGDRMERARVALGGVGTVPWRSHEAEEALQGKTANEATFQHAAQAAVAGARPLHYNAFKVKLAQLCLTRALRVVTQSS